MQVMVLCDSYIVPVTIFRFLLYLYKANTSCENVVYFFMKEYITTASPDSQDGIKGKEKMAHLYKPVWRKKILVSGKS